MEREQWQMLVLNFFRGLKPVPACVWVHCTTDCIINGEELTVLKKKKKANSIVFNCSYARVYNLYKLSKISPTDFMDIICVVKETIANDKNRFVTWTSFTLRPAMAIKR